MSVSDTIKGAIIMWKVLKIELKRSILNKWTFIAMLVTSIFCIIHFQSVYESRMSYLIRTKEEGLGKAFYICTGSAYDIWILFDFNIYSYALLLVMGIIAVLPYGVSYYTDVKSGYIKQVISRTSMKVYTRAKYIVTFISGGIVIVLPIFMEFLAIATIFPIHKPYRPSSIMYGEETFLIDLYYDYPMTFMMFRLLLVFVVAGLLATMALLVARYISNYFSIIITPFVFTFILAFCVRIAEMEEISFAYSLQAYSGNYNYGILFGQIIVMFILTYFGFVSSKKDVY